mmetsp:Transcript_3869/g.8766  ORF Transcript_3869/g.8766 Transcript_3869/m.8766 type:complete len:266 (+) Transcript_3869:1063-1860(+)
MPVGIEEHIFGLEISVDDLTRVEVLESGRDLRRIQHRSLLGKTARVLQVEKELAAVAVVHHQIQLRWSLESEAQVDEERVVRVLKGTALSLCVNHLVPLEQQLLAEHLHRIDLVIALLRFHKHYLAKRSLTQHLKALKVVGSELGFAVCKSAAHNRVSACRDPSLFFRIILLRVVLVSLSLARRCRIYGQFLRRREIPRRPMLERGLRQNLLSKIFRSISLHHLEFLLHCDFICVAQRLHDLQILQGLEAVVVLVGHVQHKLVCC